MKKIAITGNIGSGKSVVCSYLEEKGYSVIYTDKINSDLLKSKEYLKKLALIFPCAVNSGIVDKNAIRQEIALNNDKRLQLNALAHAEIKHCVENEMKKFNGKLIFCEIPLIVEANMASSFDEIWCVTADKQVKIDRIMARDNVSFDSAEKILDLQVASSELEKISNVVIVNNGNFIKLKEQIDKELVRLN